LLKSVGKSVGKRFKATLSAKKPKPAASLSSIWDSPSLWGDDISSSGTEVKSNKRVNGGHTGWEQTPVTWRDKNQLNRQSAESDSDDGSTEHFDSQEGLQNGSPHINLLNGSLGNSAKSMKKVRGNRAGLSELHSGLTPAVAQLSTTSLGHLIAESDTADTVDIAADSGSDHDTFTSSFKRKRKSKDELQPKSSKKKRIEKGSRKKSREKHEMELPYMYDSTEEGGKLFACMIHPVTSETFFSEIWEKKPLLLKRHIPDYNKGFFSTSEFDKILRQENIQWGVNLDAVTFKEDKRETHNLAGRAHAPVVWDMYQAGCSMRLLNPQTYSKSVWKVLSVLQDYFGSCVGANIYLTPANTQGFAPHYDDIEAFIIQLEGKKHWRLYNPLNEDEVLPQYSSRNFSVTEIGEPILDTVLEAGDLLYFPRGTIHQGDATDEHSLHITVSCYQKNSWGDLFKKLLPAIIDQAVSEDVTFREGLPRDYLNYMGIAFSDTPGEGQVLRRGFTNKVAGLMESLVSRLTGSGCLDSACDQMGKQFMHDALPPVLQDNEKQCSVRSAGERWEASSSRVVGVSELTPDTQVKVIRRGALRLLTESDQVRVYYSVDNARVYHGADPFFFNISSEDAPCVEHLINAYPHFTCVDDLPLDDLDAKLNVVSMLYERGLLITSQPLETTYDEGGSEEEESWGADGWTVVENDSSRKRGSVETLC